MTTKRKPLEGVSLKKKPQTAAEAVAAVTGAAAPEAAAVVPIHQERHGAGEEGEGKPTTRKYAITTVRLGTDQLKALRRAALERTEERDAGKPDAGEIIRELVDAWMRTREGR